MSVTNRALTINVTCVQRTMRDVCHTVNNIFLLAVFSMVWYGIPCIRLARGKFELTNQDSAGGKKSSVLKSSKQVRKGFEIRQLFSVGIKFPRKGIYIFLNQYKFAKSEQYELFCVSKLLFWRQKWVARSSSSIAR